MMHFFNYKNVFIILAIIVIGTRLIFSWLDMSFLLSRVVDDAFYYFKTAQNIVEKNLSTFDGINKTNGYHPLWMLCLLPIFYFTKGHSQLSIHTIMTFQAIILSAIIFLLWKILNKEFGSNYPLIGLVCLAWPRFLSQTEYGLESGLFILLLLFSAHFCLKNKIITSQNNFKKNLFFGTLLSLIFLARLDSIFYIIPVAFYILLDILKNIKQNKIKSPFKKVITVFLPVILIPLPYLLWNYSSFQHITPISGSLKHSFPRFTFSPEYFFEFKEFSAIFLISILFAIFLSLKIKTIDDFLPNKEYQAILLILSFYVILHFSDTLFFMKWAVFRWHFAGYIVFFLLAIPLIIRITKKLFLNYFSEFMVREKIKYTLITFFIIAVFAAQFISIRRSVENKFQYEAYREAIWIKDNLPQDEVFMLEDAGIISYFSDKRIINIDGVINNFEFHNYLKDRKFLQYIKEKEIKYFIHHSFWDNPDVRSGNYEEYVFKSYSHLYEVFGGDITLKKSDEIYRSKEYNHFGRKTIFIIWKIDYNDFQQ